MVEAGYDSVDPVERRGDGRGDEQEVEVGVIHDLLLLSREHDGAEDGDEDEDGGDFKGKQELGEEDGGDLRDVAGDVVEIAADVGDAEGLALGEEDEAEQAEDDGGAGGKPTK